MKKLLERERELAAVEALLERGTGVLAIEGGAGIGKTSLLEVACHRAEEAGWEVLRARGSELEAGFAFGVVRQLFEQRLAAADEAERELLLAGPAGAARPLIFPEFGEASAYDTSFAVLHGLYWLAANLAARRPLIVAVDDAHWADGPSLRWLAYLAPRVEGLTLALMLTLRPAEPASGEPPLLAVHAEPATVVCPRLLSETAVAAIVRRVGGEASDELCAALKQASGGNPFYLRELLRGIELEGRTLNELDPGELMARGGEGIARQVAARIRHIDPQALGFAQALAVLGAECELRHAAAVAGIEMERAARLAAELVRLEVLEGDDPPRFLHPIVREAVEASMASDEGDEAHHAAARLLRADGARPGLVAAHLMAVRSAGDPWVVARLREAARAAMESGAPQAAAELLGRALAGPPSSGERVDVLRELALAEEHAGRESAFAAGGSARARRRSRSARRGRASARPGARKPVPGGGCG